MVELIVVLGLFILVSIMFISGLETNQILAKLALFAAAAFRLLPSFNRILSSLQSFKYSIPVIEVVFREIQLRRKKIIRKNFFFLKNILLKNIYFKYLKMIEMF